jgi:dihydrofolate reductase
MTVYAIAAVSENGVIGKDNDLVWKLPDDMKFFKETTLDKVVIMGRKNFESIPHQYRPLPRRKNIVLTRNERYDAPGAEVFTSLEKALRWCDKKGFDDVFIIGGGEIYAEALRSEAVDVMFLTRVHGEFDGDTFFPDFPTEEWKKIVLSEHPKDHRHAYSFTIEKWIRK